MITQTKSLTKHQLRKHYQQKRQAFSDAEIAFLSHRICQHFIRHFLTDDVKRIHLFLPIAKQKEVSLWDLIRYVWGEDLSHQLFIPKVVGDELYNFPLNESTILEENHWGILEPVGEMAYTDNHYDVVITPLLYADSLGNRVGYGKGFYDRFFKTINKDALKVGVNFFAPDEHIADVYECDVPLDYLITPDGIIDFT